MKAADLYVWDGQSLMLTPNAAQSIPAKCMANLRGLSKVRADAGTTWAERQAWNVTARVDRLAQAVTGNRHLVDLAGQSDLIADMTAVDILADAEAYWTARKAAGFAVVACTIPHATNYEVGNRETEWTALNAAIRLSAVPDAVADLAALPEMQDASNTTYFGDGLHLKDPATELCYPVVLSALGTL